MTITWYTGANDNVLQVDGVALGIADGRAIASVAGFITVTRKSTGTQIGGVDWPIAMAPVDAPRGVRGLSFAATVPLDAEIDEGDVLRGVATLVATLDDDSIARGEIEAEITVRRRVSGGA